MIKTIVTIVVAVGALSACGGGDDSSENCDVIREATANAIQQGWDADAEAGTEFLIENCS